MNDLGIGQEVIGTILAMPFLEIVATLSGIIYVLLAIRENIWCWLFGIVSSAISIYLFVGAQLYAEAVLYIYYVWAGIYGWYNWGRGAEKGALPVIELKFQQHLLWIGLGLVGAILLATLLQTYTNAALPLLDAHTTVFSFIATYFVTQKVLSNWLYWIVIDAVSVGLYWNRELYYLSFLMFFYTIIAIWGFYQWRKQFKRAVISI